MPVPRLRLPIQALTMMRLRLKQMLLKKQLMLSLHMPRITASLLMVENR